MGRLGPVDVRTGPPSDLLEALHEGQMPTDPVTGLPFVLLPKAPSHLPPSAIDNYHHHFYNRRHPDLEGNFTLSSDDENGPDSLTLSQLAGFAVRVSRGQLLPIQVHQYGHREYPQGPNLPHTIDEKFITAIKACSGVVSRWALDLTLPADRRLVYMSDDVFKQVTARKVMCPERYFYDRPADHRRRILGNFFMRYAISRDLSHVSERTIDKFLNHRDQTVRRAIGNSILREAFDVMLDPLEPVYLDLKKQGMVQPGRSALRRSIKKYIHPETVPTMHPLLEQKLAS